MSTPSAIVLGRSAEERRAVGDLLAAAGFALPDGDPARNGTSLAGALVVLLSDADGTTRLREIRAIATDHPHAHVLAVVPDEASNVSLRRAILAGSTGIIFDSGIEAALVPTAAALLAGQLVVPSVLGRQIAPRPLSHREKQILALVLRGFTNGEIALKLHLAESTVKTHLSSAFRKIDARSRSEAVARIQDPETGYGPGILALADGTAR